MGKTQAFVISSNERYERVGLPCFFTIPNLTFTAVLYTFVCIKVYLSRISMGFLTHAVVVQAAIIWGVFPKGIPEKFHEDELPSRYKLRWAVNVSKPVRYESRGRMYSSFYRSTAAWFSWRFFTTEKTPENFQDLLLLQWSFHNFTYKLFGANIMMTV